MVIALIVLISVLVVSGIIFWIDYSIYVDVYGPQFPTRPSAFRERLLDGLENLDNFPVNEFSFNTDTLLFSSNIRSLKYIDRVRIFGFPVFHLAMTDGYGFIVTPWRDKELHRAIAPLYNQYRRVTRWEKK